MAFTFKTNIFGENVFKEVDKLFKVAPKGLKSFMAWYVYKGIDNILFRTAQEVKSSVIYRHVLKRTGKLGEAFNAYKDAKQWWGFEAGFDFDETTPHVPTHIGDGWQKIVAKRKYLTIPIKYGPAYVKGTNLQSKTLADFPGIKFNPRCAIWYLGNWKEKKWVFYGRKYINIERRVDPEKIASFAFSRVSEGAEQLAKESIDKFFNTGVT
jgi:hypothetical protein